jgi:YVTN family beta-propeller protein
MPRQLAATGRWLAAAWLLTTWPGQAGHASEAAKHPVYVGAQQCGRCHQGPQMGHQLSRWYLSKHAQAFASLATPEAREIAKLSGIPLEPQQSALCLGCHATAAEAEDWEKDPTFHSSDGVQCEKCHGPGSEYMTAAVMTDPKAAMAAGLKIPSARDCMGCHGEKGSHVAVLKSPPFDAAKALKEIDHPTPPEWRLRKIRLPSLPDRTEGTPHDVGVNRCGQCHTGPESGYQLSKWRSGPHANAFAILSTPAAAEIATAMGVTGNPQSARACLRCHTTAYHQPAGTHDSGYAVIEGVSCEACHGPGSRYVPAVTDAGARCAEKSLKPVTRQTCLECHADAHGKPFDYQQAVQAIAHPTERPAVVVEPRYKTPLNLCLRPPAGKELYVTCEAADCVVVVDTQTRQKVAEIAVGGQPNDITFSPDGKRAFVSNRLDDSVSVLDTTTRKVVATLPVGDEPHGLLTDRQGRLLYVLNTSADSISVLDTQTLKEVKRLSASRNPWSLARAPDGGQIFVTNTLSRFVKFRTPSMSEVTVIDTERAIVKERVVVPGSNLQQGVDWHPSGRFALITLNRTKNLVPMTRLLQGWTITNGLGVIWANGRVDQVLLDEPNSCFPDPADVAVTPDGRWALVTSSGSNRIAVVDVDKLISMLEAASDEQREEVFPNHLGKPTEFVVDHIDTGRSPRGVVITADGTTALVANSLDDSLTVIDIATRKAVATIDLDGPQVMTKARYGERLFHNAAITFHRQFSCHSCHPDGHIDGLTYDIEPDGIGSSPVDNRTLRGILDTAPFKWEGTNPSLQRQCGPRLSVFFTRLAPFTPKQLAALDLYICTIPRPPNRYRPVGAELTDAQRRGKAMFERTRSNDGEVISTDKRCVTCHFPPLYTDRQRHDVGTQLQFDHESRFDVPHLNNIYDSAPYLHNGIATTLEEIWTRYNPHDEHGLTNDMTKDQLNDLIEYLKTL